jgi:uncharacterized Zn-binding protein involved in type VI secretion
MGISVGIHPPKTPVTKGSHGIAKNTIPNICKMPGPPSPFIPTPLPNIGKSELSPKGYSKTVKIEGQSVAIRGATFESIGDMASKGTGGGLISANTHGPTKFITPGSMTVKIEGKSVHLLGEPMLNNCGPSGSPPNTGATMAGEDQDDQKKAEKCTHPRTRREPPENIGNKKPENQVKDMEAQLRKNIKRADKLSHKLANAAVTKAASIAVELQGLERDIRGQETELQIARDELAKGRLKETRVRIICEDCGAELTELDIITSDDAGNPVAKECKAGANFRQDQTITQIQEVAKHFRGGSVHLAAPSAALPAGSPTKGWKVKPVIQAH